MPGEQQADRLLIYVDKVLEGLTLLGIAKHMTEHPTSHWLRSRGGSGGLLRRLCGFPPMLKGAVFRGRKHWPFGNPISVSGRTLSFAVNKVIIIIFNE